MKNSLRFFYGVILFALCQVGLTNCSDGDDGENNGSADNGITAITNETEKTVTVYGETVEVSFTAAAGWTSSLKYSTGSDWARISNISGNSSAGKGGFRLSVSKNETGKERVLTVLVQVEGYKIPETVCTVTQSGTEEGAKFPLLMSL